MSVEASPDTLRQLYSQISEIDAELALAADTATAGKRKMTNDIRKEVAENNSDVVEQITTVVKFLSDLDARVLTGALSLFTENTKELDKKVDEYITAQVKAQEENKNGAEKPSQERVAELSASRRDLNEKYKVLRSFLEMFDADSVKDIPVPAIMRGLPGKRGKNVFKSFNFSLSPVSETQPADSEFEARSENTNSISSIASTVLNITAQELRNYLKSQGVDIENPVSPFIVKLSNGRWLKGEKGDTDNPNEPDEVVDGTEDVNTDETVTAEV